MPNQIVTFGLKPVIMTMAEFTKMAENDFQGFRELTGKTESLSESEVIAQLNNFTIQRLIVESSFYRKAKIKPNFKNPTRSELVEYYLQCRNYATRSIIDSLYPVDQLKKPIQHLDCSKEKFYILSRVRTNYEKPTVQETAKARTYISFSLNNQLNLSHFPGLIWYGYRSRIKPNMIGLIYPQDADTRSWAYDRLDLGAERECLLDAEDLMLASTKKQTYSQISIKSNDTVYSGQDTIEEPITADCILCIDHVNDLSQRESDKQSLPILVLHPSEQTLCRVYDPYSIPELSHPKYL